MHLFMLEQLSLQGFAAGGHGMCSQELLCDPVTSFGLLGNWTWFILRSSMYGWQLPLISVLYILYTWLLCSIMCVPAADFCREIHHGNLNNGSLPIRLLSCIYSSCYRPHFSYFVKEVNSFLNFHRIYINTGILYQPSNTLILHCFLKKTMNFSVSV